MKVYVPDDAYFTGETLPPNFLTKHARPELPVKMRYYGGQVRPERTGWIAWSDTNITVVKEAVTIAPHVRLVALVSEKPAFKGLHGISLVLDTANGPVVFLSGVPTQA